MPVYRAKDGERGKWRIVINVHGRQREKIFWGTKKEGDAEEGRWLLELKADGPIDRSRLPTLLELCATRYKTYAQLHLRRTTWIARRSHLNFVCSVELNKDTKRSLGTTRIDKIETNDVLLYQEKRKLEGLKPRSINNELKSLQAVLTYARDELKLPAAEPSFPMLKARKGKHAETWTEAEVQRLYAALEQYAPALLPIAVFCLNTGARKSEAIAMRWEDVDLANGTVTITPYEDEDDGEEFDTKNNKARTVPISDALIPWLSGTRKSARWLFPSRRGKRYACFPKEQWYRATKAVKLTGGPHKMRHTYASHFLADTPDLYLLGQRLSHSHERVTELYAHLLPKHAERARNAVNLAPAVGPSRLEAKKRWSRKGRK